MIFYQAGSGGTRFFSGWVPAEQRFFSAVPAEQIFSPAGSRRNKTFPRTGYGRTRAFARDDPGQSKFLSPRLCRNTPGVCQSWGRNHFAFMPLAVYDFHCAMLISTSDTRQSVCGIVASSCMEEPRPKYTRHVHGCLF